MKVGLLLLLGSAAFVASFLAVLAGPNVALALIAGAVAVGTGAVLLVGMVERTRWPRERPIPILGADPNRVRMLLGSRRHGRSDLILMLDVLERTTCNPNLSMTSTEEVARLRAMDLEQFYRYLEDRLTYLEARS